jgi:hypothetical protein
MVRREGGVPGNECRAVVPVEWFEVMVSRLSILLLCVAPALPLAGQTALCRAAQLEPFTSAAPDTAGTFNTVIELRNTGSLPCLLPVHTLAVVVDGNGNPFSSGLHDLRLPPTPAPVLLAPGGFAEFRATDNMYNWAPTSLTSFLLRFAAGDPGAIRIDGHPSLEGPYPVAGPGLTPASEPANLELSVMPWPEEPQPGAFSLGRLHLSVTNGGMTPSSNWDHCTIQVTVTELDGPATARESEPCHWNGDILRGAIAARATIAQEVTVLPPAVCRTSAYTVRIAVDGAPVPVRPVTLHSAVYEPVCARLGTSMRH